MKKIRLDQLVFDLGLTESRERAKTTIMSGLVFVDGQRADKPGMQVSPNASVEVKGAALPYVSRGGLKLEKALKVFPIDPSGRTCIDCGASTGGFTDCMLQNGASKVYAVDVGYGQLDWKLRSDPRVVCLERTNARYLDHEQIPDELDFASIDVSFISLKLIFPALYGLLRQLYRRCGGNEDFFAVAPGDYDAGLGQADMTLSRVRYRQALDQAEDLPQMTPDTLTAAYPGLGQSVAQVIHNTDERCKTLQ